MLSAYIVTGTLKDELTVLLDEALPIKPAEVRLIIEPVAVTPRRRYKEVISEIHHRQAARGQMAATRVEIDRYLETERNSWDS